jgi:CRP/FNR family transcriptional regulator, cyclic AMP receptor protein
MASKSNTPFNPLTFFAKVGCGKSILKLKKNGILFSQGDTPDAVFYIEAGTVKLSVVSEQGKRGVVAILGGGSFVGEGCLAGQPVRMATASAEEMCTIVRIEKSAMLGMLQEDATFSALFAAYVLSRNIRVEEDLVDHLFNSSEKRLARVLLSMAHFERESQPETLRLGQETLAEMIGTTRSRTSFFLNKFRRSGFIDYNRGAMQVRSSLLKVLQRDS